MVNRAPDARFRRREIFAELTSTVPHVDVVFVPHDGKVAEAAWDGGRSGAAGTRAVEGLAAGVASVRPRPSADTVMEPAW